jgi:hypothetical protein
MSEINLIFIAVLKRKIMLYSARKPLKLKDVEFPLRQTVEENFTLEVYLDIAMRQDLYEEIVKVKWGRVTEQGEEEWFPNDHRLAFNATREFSSYGHRLSYSALLC